MKKTKDEQLSLADTEEGEILTRLSEKVERAVATITELRRERDSLRQRLDDAETKLREHEGNSDRLTSLEEEQDRFRRERSEIRERIETILSNLEGLEEAPAEE